MCVCVCARACGLCGVNGPKPVVNCRNGDVIKCIITSLFESQSLCVTLFSSEVRQSLSTAQSHYSQWCMLLDSDVDIDKIQGVASELRNCIKSIDWDLEDLEQTISILSHVVIVLSVVE